MYNPAIYIRHENLKEFKQLVTNVNDMNILERHERPTNPKVIDQQ